MGTPRLTSPHLLTLQGQMHLPHCADSPQGSPPLSKVVWGWGRAGVGSGRHKIQTSSHDWNKHGKGKGRPWGLGCGKDRARKAGLFMTWGYKTRNLMLPFPNIFWDNQIERNSEQFQQFACLIGMLLITLSAVAQVKPGGFSQKEEFPCSAVAGCLCDADSSVAVPQRR